MESPSGFDSSRGRHHPSHECFRAGTPEGHVESIHEEEATLTNDLNGEVAGDARAPPRLWVEQLKVTKSSRKHDSSSSRNARSSSKRLSAMETGGAHMPWPMT